VTRKFTFTRYTNILEEITYTSFKLGFSTNYGVPSNQLVNNSYHYKITIVIEERFGSEQKDMIVNIPWESSDPTHTVLE